MNCGKPQARNPLIMSTSLVTLDMSSPVGILS
jgi:hypothetical protein